MSVGRPCGIGPAAAIGRAGEGLEFASVGRGRLPSSPPLPWRVCSNDPWSQYSCDALGGDYGRRLRVVAGPVLLGLENELGAENWTIASRAR